MFDDKFSFSLPRTFPAKIGWTSAVRRRANDPAAHEFLARRYPRIFVGTSPAVVLANWEPLAGEMLYYVRRSPAGVLSFFATDRLFVHEIALTADRQTPESAAVRELLSAISRARTEDHSTASCPIAPNRAGYPSALLRHVLSSERVNMIVVPSIARAQQEDACV